jgi:FkbM family methyltransferase
MPKIETNSKSSLSHQLVHPIFQFFQPWSGEGDGIYFRDFLGVKTDPKYRYSWKAQPLGKKIKLGYPKPNQQYFEWLFFLSTVLEAINQYTIIELGAGYAPWLIRAAFALKQISPNMPVLLVAVEGDPTHYKWMLEHFENNNISPKEHLLFEALVSDQDATAKFPNLKDPSKNYGASVIRQDSPAQTLQKDFIEVKTVSMNTILSKISSAVDLIHMDIQGYEQQVLHNSIELISTKVKKILVATHRSEFLHNNVYKFMREHGWLPRYNFDRNSKWATEWGTIQFGDGCQCWVNPSFTDKE